MLLRRVGGRLRWLPGDVLAVPVFALGLGLFVGLEVLTSHAVDGPWTVRVIVASPTAWLTRVLGWVGLILLGAGAVLEYLSRHLARPGRRLTVVRFLPYRFAAVVLAVGVGLSMWRLSEFVADLGSGGAQWRFLATARVRWVNDLTTVLLVAATVACLALSFGRKRPVDTSAPARPSPAEPLLEFEDVVPVEAEPRQRRVGKRAQVKRERVPTTTAPKATTRTTRPAGVPTQTRSRARSSPTDGD